MLSKIFLDRITDAEKKLKAWSKDAFKALDVTHKVETPLYHYTTAAGLQGILRDQAFWCTSIFHLNDPSELEYGISLVRGMFGAKARLRRHGAGNRRRFGGEFRA